MPPSGAAHSLTRRGTTVMTDSCFVHVGVWWSGVRAAAQRSMDCKDFDTKGKVLAVEQASDRLERLNLRLEMTNDRVVATVVRDGPSISMLLTDGEEHTFAPSSDKAGDWVLFSTRRRGIHGVLVRSDIVIPQQPTAPPRR